MMDAWVILGIDCLSSSTTDTAATTTSDSNCRTPAIAATLTPAGAATATTTYATDNNGDNKLALFQPSLSVQPPSIKPPPSSIPGSMESIIYNWRAQAEDSMRAAGKTGLTSNQVSLSIYVTISCIQ